MSKKILTSLLLLLVMATTASAQSLLYTKTGKIYFNCTGGVEPIEGVNKSVLCALEPKSGKLQFSLQMKGFEFEKDLMKEHFNENYVESDKYPKADFAGQVTNNAEVNYAKDGVYNVKVSGKLSMHNVSKDVSTTGKITIKGGVATATAEFSVLLSDYKVDIPALVKDKISKDAKITVTCVLDQKK